MDCKAAYAYLFQYAKGQIVPDDKENVERHIAGCDACKGIADALATLAPSPDEPDNHRVRYRRMTRVYPRHIMASVGIGGGGTIAPSPEAPGLMLGRMNNLVRGFRVEPSVMEVDLQ